MTKKMIYLALLVTMSLVLSLVEQSIPVPFLPAGAKLGLSNVIVVFALYTLPKTTDVMMIIVVKLILSCIFGAGMSGFLYSSMGAIFSFSVMFLVKTLLSRFVSVIGVSILGSVFHHIGQLVVAMLVVQNAGVFLYLPVLTGVGILTGFFVGLVNFYLFPFHRLLKQRSNPL